MELTDAAVVVTGGAGGLGERVCSAFAACGSRVAVVDLGRQGEAEALARRLLEEGAADSLAIEADVTRGTSISGMVDEVLASWGRLDVLVNAAAINQMVPFEDLEAMTEELWELLLRVDLTGPWLCSKAVAPVMKRQGRGRIVNVSSQAGLAPMGSSIAYAVAKAGVAHLTRCLAVALAPEVLVNGVCPGLMETTGMGRKLTPAQVDAFYSRAALGRSVRIEDVADQIVTLARSDSTTGHNVVVDAGSVFR